MRPHKISIKRKKGFNLDHQKNKFVLFIEDGKKFDNELPLDTHIANFIKKFISKKVFKNIALVLPKNNAVYTSTLSRTIKTLNAVVKNGFIYRKHN